MGWPYNLGLSLAVYDLGAYNRDLYRAITAMTRDLRFQCFTEGPPCLFTTYDKPGVLGILFNTDSSEEMDFLIGDKNFLY